MWKDDNLRLIRKIRIECGVSSTYHFFNIENTIKEEEIETISPVEVAALNGSIEGSIFGYQLSGEDNVINRMMNDKNDQFIKGLYLCSGFEGDIYRELSSYMQGVDAALKVINGGDKWW